MVTFIIKANVKEIAKKEGITKEQIIEILTCHFTEETGCFGSECWLDDIIEENINK